MLLKLLSPDYGAGKVAVKTPPEDTFTSLVEITLIFNCRFYFPRVAEEEDDDDIQICEAGEPVVRKAAPPPPAEDGVICLE